MAPTNASMESLPSKQKNKLRKPIVEKMRRDRINGSIEQLKLLLGKEFHAQEANAKLEKADILETAVGYLARHTTVTSGQKSPLKEYREGFSQCLREALQFLSHHAASAETQLKLLNHFQTPHRPVKMEPGLLLSPEVYPSYKTPTKQEVLTTTSGQLWRPW